MAEFRVSARAEANLLDIYLFGVGNFGRPQAVKYQFEFEDCFAMLARHPHIGRQADTIRPGLRRHDHRSHVILYEAREDHVAIIAVLHGRSMLDLDS